MKIEFVDFVLLVSLMTFLAFLWGVIDGTISFKCGS